MRGGKGSNVCTKASHNHAVLHLAVLHLVASAHAVDLLVHLRPEGLECQTKVLYTKK